MADETPQSEEIDPLSLFPEQVQETVTGLAYLGQITETIEFCGHTFGLRTLLPQDKFAIGMVVQPYRNSLVEVDVWQAAHVAATLTDIDGDPDFCPPLGPSLEGAIKGRLNYVSQNFYPPTIDFLWSNYQLLEAKAVAAMQELDRLSTGNRPTTLPPWLDSLIVPGDSPDETASGIQPSTPSSSD